MLARYPGIPCSLSTVCAAVLVLAAVSSPAGPAHGFGLTLSWGDGVKAATDDLNALGEQDPEGRKKTTAQQRLEREFDRMTGKIAGKAADKAEEYIIKAGKKAGELAGEDEEVRPIGEEGRPAIRADCREGVALFGSRRNNLGSRIPGRGQGDRPVHRHAADGPAFR